MEWGWDNARAFIGIAMIFGIAWGLSENRKAFPWKIVLGAVALQFTFALLFFGVPKLFGLESIFGSGAEPNPVIKTLEDATRAGTSFVFGYVGDNQAAGALMEGSPPPQFLLSNFTYYYRRCRFVRYIVALACFTLGYTRIRIRFPQNHGARRRHILSRFGKRVMGMTEAPVLVKPYIKGMTRSELFILMTTGFATIAGSVLIIYTTFLEGQLNNPLATLLTASLMAAPAAVALALTIVPEKHTVSERSHEPDFEYESTMDAFATGASDGLKIVLNIATMLIAALALLFIANVLLSVLPSIGGEKLSIQRVLGWVFSPLMYMIGVPLSEAASSGSLMGIKTVLTEFVAFIELGNVSPEALNERSRMITAHAICGFANFGSIGILIGGLSIIEPKRRTTFLELAWKTLVAGTLATCLSGAVVGALPAALFLGS